MVPGLESDPFVATNQVVLRNVRDSSGSKRAEEPLELVDRFSSSDVRCSPINRDLGEKRRVMTTSLLSSSEHTLCRPGLISRGRRTRASTVGTASRFQPHLFDQTVARVQGVPLTYIYRSAHSPVPIQPAAKLRPLFLLRRRRAVGGCRSGGRGGNNRFGRALQ